MRTPLSVTYQSSDEYRPGTSLLSPGPLLAHHTLNLPKSFLLQIQCLDLEPAVLPTMLGRLASCQEIGAPLHTLASFSTR